MNDEFLKFALQHCQHWTKLAYWVNLIFRAPVWNEQEMYQQLKLMPTRIFLKYGKRSKLVSCPVVSYIVQLYVATSQAKIHFGAACICPFQFSCEICITTRPSLYKKLAVYVSDKCVHNASIEKLLKIVTIGTFLTHITVTGDSGIRPRKPVHCRCKTSTIRPLGLLHTYTYPYWCTYTG